MTANEKKNYLSLETAKTFTTDFSVRKTKNNAAESNWLNQSPIITAYVSPKAFIPPFSLVLFHPKKRFLHTSGFEAVHGGDGGGGGLLVLKGSDYSGRCSSLNKALLLDW